MPSQLRARVTLIVAALGALVLAPDAGAQNGSLRVTTPSPTAASLGKFGDVPVNLYSGVPDISIPLFTAKGRTLELPIVLKYHAGGIRVEEIGSWVGLGWALEAGGAITRTVRGQVDESPSGYFNTGHTFWSDSNWSNPPHSLLQDISEGHVDGDPDQFFFSFAGRSGQFVMGPTSTSTSVKEYRAIPYQQLRIVPTIVQDEITQWVITSEDGTRYTFAAAEATVDQSSTSSDLGSHLGESHNSSWHLTEIRSAGGDVVTLHYRTYTAMHRQGEYRELFSHVVTNPSTADACVPNSADVSNVYQITTQKLDSIKTAAHTVKFTVGTSLRLDALAPGGAQQEPRLDKITVTTPTGTVLREFHLEHDYFDATDAGRLRLTSVYEKDRNGVSLPPYSFTYDSQTLPARTSFAQDHWGFYNGESNTGLIPTTVGPGGFVHQGADRTPDPAKMKMASLTKITYPTGGYSEFVFEANDYGSIGGTTLPVSEGPSQSQSVSSSRTDGPETETFTIGGTQSTIVTVEVTQSPADCEGQDWPPCPFTEIVGHGYWQTSGTYSVTLAPGTYTIRASNEFNEEASATIIVTWRDQGLTAGRKTGGGLRVAEVRIGDAMGNITVRKYRYTLQSDTTRSSGVVSVEPDYDYEFNSSACSFYSRSAVSKLPLGSGPPVGYSEVTVWHGANGEFGKTRHAFLSILDVNDPAPEGVWPFSPRTSYEWKRGQETVAAEYDASGRIQQRTSSAYTFKDEGTPEPTTTRKFRALSVNSFAGGCYYCTQYAFNRYEVISAWAFQSGATVEVFDTTGTSSFSTVRSHVHGNPAHLQLTELTETNSDGTQRITRMKYPADYATGTGNAEASAISQMQGSAHIHSPAIERWVTKRANGIDSVVTAELTTFKEFASGQFLPYQRFVLNNPHPVTNLAVSSVSGGAFAKDSRYLLQETANGYDAQGRIIQLADARGKLTYYSYGGNANNAFLTWVTQAKDATGNADLWTSFSYDADGYLSSTMDNNGYARHFTYDLFGRLRQVKNHDGAVVKAYGYTYSRTGPGWTFNTASPNAIVDTTFMQHTPSQKAVVSTQYLDGIGRSIQAVVRDGGSYVVAATQYDAMGRPWRTWKPYTRTTAGYDANFASNDTSFYNGYLGVTGAKPYTETLYTADALARPSKVIPEYIGTSPSAWVRHEHGLDAVAKQQIAQLTDESGKKTRRFADAFGNEVKTVLGFGAAEATTTLAEFDILGQRRKTTDPRGIITTYRVDTRGLLISRVNPDAGTASVKHDRAGNPRYSQDANQAAAGEVHFTTYDFANRPLVSGVGAASFAALDPDAASAPALETTQSHWREVYEYDQNPDTAVFPWSLFAAQIAAHPVYNVAGRLAAVASKSHDVWQVSLMSYGHYGAPAFRHTFTQAAGGGSVLTALNTSVYYTRDLRDALTERSTRVGGVAFNQWYDYDDRGLLAKVFASSGWTKPATPDVTYAYRPSGEIASRQFQGGPLVTLRYGIREQLETIGDPATTTYPFSARYAYHPNGTVSEAEFYSAGTPAAAKRYMYMFPTNRYDALNRLKGADFALWTGSSWIPSPMYDVEQIGYDASGNIITLQRWDETGNYIDNLAYTYPTGSNRLSSVSDWVGSTPATWDAETGSFTWDANGNLATAPAPYAITSATYDHRNLPLSLTSNGAATSYRYDHTGQRITKQVGSGDTEVYVLEGPTTLAVFTVNGSGTRTAWHFNVLAGDRVVGRQPSTGSRRYYHTDLLGSTRSVVEGATVVESYDFDPWGVLMPGRTLGSATKEGFTSKERDAESGLDYFGARYYMAAIGRWTSVDPLADKHPEWSPYNYVLNNPLVLIDPDGRQVRAQLRQSLSAADARQMLVGVGRDPRIIMANRAAEAAGRVGMTVSGAQDLVDAAHAVDNGRFWEGGARLAMVFPVGRIVRGARLVDNVIDAADDAARAVGRAGEASNAMDAVRLAADLRLEDASRVFTATGGLQAEVIHKSARIIEGTSLNNPAVVRELTRDGSNLADWGKYVSETHSSPAGAFQVHFYYNRVSGAVNTTIDYKAVFNKVGSK